MRSELNCGLCALGFITPSRTPIQRLHPSVNVAVLVVALGISSASAQSLGEVYREAGQVDDLVNNGRYVEAAKLANSMLDRLHRSHREGQALPFLAYLAKTGLETGQIAQASGLLKSAEPILLNFYRERHFEPALMREKAAFYYASAQYDSAAAAASKAVQLSQEYNYEKIRTEYCRGIQALAHLRSGNTTEAERLVSIALNAVPKRSGRSPVFAPRILYSACIVESHMDKLTVAERLCQRGLEFAGYSRPQTRDLSLGYLALAEAYLQAGDLSHSREFAQQAADLTAQLFGTQHQDMVDALDFLAIVSLKEGDTAAAHARIAQAIPIANKLFGDGSPGAAVSARVLEAIVAGERKQP